MAPKHEIGLRAYVRRSSVVKKGPMSDSSSSIQQDDRLTVISISVLACILQDILHEGLGHGLTAWISGAQKLTLSTVALQSDNSTRWISANGTLVNLFFAAILWLVLLRAERYKPAIRYFLVLAMAGNLFTGTGYFLFSGVSNFGDWAAVIAGWEPHWMWRLGLVAVGTVSYYASMMLVADQLKAFEGKSRRRRLSWTPYFTDGILAALGGLFNPFGWFYIVASALPSTLGANAGLLSLPSMMRNRHVIEEERTGPIPRNRALIISAAIAGLLFIFVLGRGITVSR